MKFYLSRAMIGLVLHSKGPRSLQPNLTNPSVVADQGVADHLPVKRDGSLACLVSW